jgi:hypothetical protein
MSYNYENFLNELIINTDQSSIQANISNLDYNDIYNNYNYNYEEYKNQVITANLDYSFDNVILNEFNYKKIKSASFNEQYNKLLKQDEQYKEMIFHLQSNIDNTYYSNVIIGNKQAKIDKIEKDLTCIYGNIFYDRTIDKAEMYYNYLKSTKLYHILYDFYLKYGSRFYRDPVYHTFTWNINNVFISMSNLINLINQNYIELCVRYSEVSIFKTITNNESFDGNNYNNLFSKYSVIPIVQILYIIDSLKDKSDKSKWYIILHKLIKTHKIYIKQYFPE